MKFILGKKKEMTRRFGEDGTVTPVTVIEAGPCVVTQVRTKEHDGVNAVQIGFGARKRLTKSQAGHLKELPPFRHFRDFRVDDPTAWQRGKALDVDVFSVGDVVHVTGTTKGRGFAGVVKRHGFAGSPASHGHKDQLRMPGSIGSTDPQRVFKGKRMGGHMGDTQVTIRNLSVVAVDPAKHEILVSGAVPGSRNSLVVIRTDAGAAEATT